MMDLHSLINEYFSITSRPVATMTVDEYLKFVSLSQVQIQPSETLTKGVQGVIPCTPEIETSNSHTLYKEENTEISAKKKNEVVPSNAINNSKAEKSKETSSLSRKTKESEVVTRQSTESMMAMLRSVSG